MASAPGPWDTLSRSSKQALRWAAAAARLRAERSGQSPGSAEVDEFDLLVGTLLAHPVDSEPRALLTHVGATAADVLPPDYPMPTEELLARHAASVAASQAPPLTRPVDGLLTSASTQPLGGDGVVELRVLFGGLLTGPNRVSTAFRDLLSRSGLPEVIATYDQYLAEASSASSADGYAEFLASRHPFSAQPVEIPRYKADHGPGSMGEDLVDIHGEVDAFSYLLASTALRPPLAVGLFGHWGSGKSYFMDSVRSRIDQLVTSDEVKTRPQAQVPFWKRVVQIDFNAWHYVDGDLWASLVEHIFAELRIDEGEPATEVEKRQSAWLGKIDEKLRERGELVSKKDRKDEALTQAQRRLAKAEATCVAEEAKRKKAPGERLAEDTLEIVQAALVGLVDERTGGGASETLDAIDEARTELRRGTGLTQRFQWRDRRTIAAVVALVALPGVLWLLADRTTVPQVAQFFAGLSAFLATVTVAIRGATAQVRSRLDALDRADRAVRDEMADKRRLLDAAVDEAQDAVDARAGEVAELAADAQVLTDEIDLLRRQVAGVSTGQLLSEFVAERFGSVDYRARLGTQALVQRDFRRLSTLIEEQNKECLRSEEAEPGHEVVNRIILYVDDLDRCEADRVVEVLQAVHLLLAFPLFVVVVAVDDRWLSQALSDRYPALVGSPRSDEHARPADYLEKIFQVPFWIEALPPPARRAMVRGLLQDSVVGTAGGDDENVDPLEVTPDQRSLLTTMFTGRTALRRSAQALTLTVDELRFLDGLGPLLGTTPRSIKRFVNVYQLLCALPPLETSPDAHPYEQLVGFLLAVTDGLPRLVVLLRQRVDEAGSSETLATAIADIRADAGKEEMRRYDAWIAENEGWDDFPLDALAGTAERVRRFSFR